MFDMICDFHTHTFLSDGVLSPMELIRRAVNNGYRAIAITDHAGPGELERFITEVTRDCALAERYWNIRAIPGVELTHLPPPSIPEIARQAREMGARLIIVHGETTVEPVEAGTNEAAVSSPHVDILAHPGKISESTAAAAAARGIFLEISTRKGHSRTNTHVAAMARTSGAKLLLNSDAHNEDDLLTEKSRETFLSNIDLDEAQREGLLVINPDNLLARLTI